MAQFEETDKAAAKIESIKRELAKAEEQAQLELAEMDNRRKDIEAELAGLTEKRELAAVDVDKKWLKEYDGILDNKKDIALVRVEHCVCSGCNMTLPPHIVHESKRRDILVNCSFCGRLLY